VNPFWLRSALVKYQLNDIKGGYDLLKRIEVRFPDDPEVRVASALFLYSQRKQQENDDLTLAQQKKVLEIPDRQRLKYSDHDYIDNIISWPPKMIDTLSIIANAVGDTKRGNSSLRSSSSSSNDNNAI
jgi:hypothetical protein